MNKLKGTSSLSIHDAPQQKQSMGLLKKQSAQSNFEMKTFRLSKQAIEALEQLAANLTQEAGFRIAMGKALELAIFSAKGKSLEKLTKITK